MKRSTSPLSAERLFLRCVLFIHTLSRCVLRSNLNRIRFNLIGTYILALGGASLHPMSECSATRRVRLMKHIKICKYTL
ncbi:hypothetical protein CANCADRAFT_111166 [Tortispora caseinolytica NRRL Y-17796]|uniref:Uncharacterized protein n=1 Tax=Tortispora caseinolytica NRRL Y-17796 TaxID=767744 RepID=A0A1E4TG97_9ASCO|nr:hypothetical protein CANCADRAFT_111166 [Tortispora caseinolytica NRRL Y-17796]